MKRKILSLAVAMLLLVINVVPVAAYSSTGLSGQVVGNPITSASAITRIEDEFQFTEKFTITQTGTAIQPFSYTWKLGTMQVLSKGGIQYGDATTVSDSALINNLSIGSVTYPRTVGYHYFEDIISDAAFQTKLSQMTFSAPGIYYWIITKTKTWNDPELTNNGSANSTAVETTDTALVIRVNDITTSGALTLKATVGISPVDSATGLPDTQTKMGEYVDQYPVKQDTFELKKIVTGTQGDKTKYFKFTVDISKATPGLTLDVTGGATHASNPTTIALNASGEAFDVVFYLKHDEKVIIENLISGASITVTESENEGYDVSWSDGTSGVSTSAIMAGANKTLNCINDKDVLTPTGVLLSVAPALAVIMIGGLGLIVILASRRKRQR